MSRPKPVNPFDAFLSKCVRDSIEGYPVSDPLTPDERAGQTAIESATGCQECEDGWQTAVVPGRGLSDGLTEDIKVVPCPFCCGTARRHP